MDQSAPPLAPPATLPGGRHLPSPKVALVVEDEVIVRMMTAEILAARDLSVIEVGDGPAALAVLAQRPDVDLMLVDVAMPNGMDGLELARVAADRYPSLSILVVSGRAEPSAADMPPRTRFLPKPYSGQGLNWAVDEALSLP